MSTFLLDWRTLFVVPSVREQVLLSQLWRAPLIGDD